MREANLRYRNSSTRVILLRFCERIRVTVVSGKEAEVVRIWLISGRQVCLFRLMNTECINVRFSQFRVTRIRPGIHPEIPEIVPASEFAFSDAGEN